MKTQKGFTLIRAADRRRDHRHHRRDRDPEPAPGRVSANESATIGDIRTVISGQAAFQSANGGWYGGSLSCSQQPVRRCRVHPELSRWRAHVPGRGDRGPNGRREVRLQPAQQRRCGSGPDQHERVGHEQRVLVRVPCEPGEPGSDGRARIRRRRERRHLFQHDGRDAGDDRHRRPRHHLGDLQHPAVVVAGGTRPGGFPRPFSLLDVPERAQPFSRFRFVHAAGRAALRVACQEAGLVPLQLAHSSCCCRVVESNGVGAARGRRARSKRSNPQRPSSSLRRRAYWSWSRTDTHMSSASVEGW